MIDTTLWFVFKLWKTIPAHHNGNADEMKYILIESKLNVTM
jgi:hypothetical protein